MRNDEPHAIFESVSQKSKIRHILIFTDGTGNSSGKLFKTNVWRTYKAADLADPQDPLQPRQFAYYHDGVGTSSFKPLAILGGAFGMGLARSVRDSYAFVCRTYRPGDKIFVFGFSRGAFAARLVASLILDQGIIHYEGSEAELQRRVADAYRTYRRERFTWSLQPLVPVIRMLRDFTIDTWRHATLGRTYPSYDKRKNFGSGNHGDLEIEFVGVWDTVSAYGLPVDELTRAIDYFVWPLSMPDYNLSPHVKRGMHALSLDDERNTFHPQLWNETPTAQRSEGATSSVLDELRDKFLEPENEEGASGSPASSPETFRKRIRDERISQVWFAGVHSDVGGGYPDEGLSYVSLRWIMEGAETAGVRFCQDICDQYMALSDENGPSHDSRQGLGGYYRYNPRRLERLTRDASPPVTLNSFKVHESVFRRIKVGQDGYAPITLPPQFEVVHIDGSIVPGIEYLDTALGPESAYGRHREHVYNWVWWRRIAYFFTLFSTLALAAAPLYKPPLPKGACESGFCFVSEWVAAVGLVLPGFAATWTDTFASHPATFLGLAVLIAFGLFAGQFYDQRIRDDMRRIWYEMPATTPAKVGQGYPLPQKAGKLNELVQDIRQSERYRKTFRLITKGLLPTCFMVLVAYASVAMISRMTFSVQDSFGRICEAGTSRASGQNPASAEFRTNSLCEGTGISLSKGGTYRLTFEIPIDAAWSDATIPAGPKGVVPACLKSWTALRMAVFVPLRRRLNQPWFKPMARINATGTDDYALDPEPSLPDKPDVGDEQCPAASASGPTTFSTEFVARSSGELYLYVNDAIFPPLVNTWFYGNNHGKATIRVERLKGPALQDAVPLAPKPAQ